MEKKIILNGKELTEEEFLEEKKKAEEKGIKLVEVSPNQYRTKLEG